MRGSSRGKSTSTHSRERASLRLRPDTPSARISLQSDHVRIPIPSSACLNDHARTKMWTALSRTQIASTVAHVIRQITYVYTHVFSPNGQTVHGAANLASWAREAASPARAGQIEGRDLPPGDLGRGIPVPNLDVQPLVWIETRLVTEGSQSRLLLVEEGHPV